MFCGMVHPRTIDCIVNRGRLVYATKAWVKSFNIEFRAEDSDSQFSESADTHSCIEGYMFSLVKSLQKRNVTRTFVWGWQAKTPLRRSTLNSASERAYFAVLS